MNSDSFVSFASRRAFEISYATHRLAASLQDSAFSAFLKKESLALLAASAAGEYSAALKSANSLEYIVRLGQETGAMSIANAKILLAEITRFCDSLDLTQHAAEEPNLANYFSHDEGIAALVPDLYSESGNETAKEDSRNEIAKAGSGKEDVRVSFDPAKGTNPAIAVLPGIRQSGKARQEELPDVDAEIAEEIDGIAVDDETAVDGELFDAGIDTEEETSSSIVKRHMIILDYIRKNGSCKIKDLQELLPDVSERTLRYDIRTMIDKGVIERVGSGGPFSFYKEREDASVGAFGLQEE